MNTDLSGQRAELYALLDKEAPEIVSRRSGWERVVPLADGAVVLVLSLSQDKASVYVKPEGPDGARLLRDHQDTLARRLKVTPGHGSGQAEKGYWYRKDNPKACFTIRRQWPEAIRWFRAQHATYYKAFAELEDIR
ncbi:hypothetical protein [Sagittula stellata]|uniref:Methionine sulfoxide reductase B n=1 Tax=Sagittula stellata (strain ATCC 700073 / DSM 11524 / E-37) TaxID=388399 RepID=A3K536_SAGS3|nr:hypothetical protein [Sagittula stellata]EBA07637.1 methionine sulfoxide reductase B [Sagittula stellata E-37]